MTSTRWVLACALLLSAATGLQHQAPFSDGPTAPSNILMVTMGGTRSHKVPFMALGHPKIAAFLTHGGLLSMFETVYHGVPVVTLPVFCDHDANSAKAHDDGYAIRLELQHLSADELHAALQAVTEDPKYRAAAKYRQAILRDQSVGPLRTAVYWTEYVLRHRGAAHLQAPVRDMPLYQWLLLDVMVVYALIAYVAYKTIASMARFAYRSVVSAPAPRASSKANGVLPNGLANDIANGVANGIANGVAHSLSSGVTSGKKTN
ncbi:UDP-glycosyltransferase-32b [Frankliniella occidentalis]|nr:UDP-glycosyltransferase-32b [Frankliniella occidentalis]